MACVKCLLLGKVKSYGNDDAIDALGKPWKSAIFKIAQNKEIFANELGFYGDSVADTIHHGGPEKAIFANSWQNYPSWEKFLNLKNLPLGAMGENLTVDGLDENSVCIGDVHKIGSLILQVSQPRKPCFKLSKRWNTAGMAKEIFATGRTGWYYRVLEKGSCKTGDKIEILRQDEIKMSIMELNKLFFDPKNNFYLKEKLDILTTVTKGWQETVKARIDGSANLKFMEEI